MTKSSPSRACNCGSSIIPDVEIIDTCANGREAIRTIKTEKPDLVFLDIQMPGFDGFSVVKGVMEIEPPLFVFVTAYQEHAIRAFEANAVNYLMKPVDEDKLADTLDRVRTRLAEKRSAEEAEKLQGRAGRSRARRDGELSPTDDESTARYEKLINIKDRGQIFRVDVDLDRAHRSRRRLHVHLHRRQFADPARDDEGSRTPARPPRASSASTARPSSTSTRSGRSSRTPTANASWCSKAARR